MKNEEQFNNLTGEYYDDGINDDAQQKPSPSWPSITSRDEDEQDADVQQESEQVGKSTDGSTKWPSLTGHLVGNADEDPEPVEKSNGIDLASCFHRVLGGHSKQIQKAISMAVPIFAAVEKAGKDERIVYGIVYEPDVKDSQGDQANAEEIKKAAYDFMENVQALKVNHKGRVGKMKILESYIAPEDLTIAKRSIKKGSWVIAARVLDKKVWEDVKAGKLTGFSMAGYARIA